MRFLVTGLPRSRTAWLASFLRCPHEPLTYCGSIDELGDVVGRMDGGCCDTLALLLWERIRIEWPLVRLVAIRRNPKEVRASLRSIGLPASYIGAGVKALESLCAAPDVLVVDYSDLNTRLPEIWQWCWGTPMRDCADALKHCRITCDHNELLSRLDPARLKSLMES